jgi:AbrB family looped-hinge helix DNA binding protein
MNKKGGITIPSKIRKIEGFKEGQKFAFLKTEDGYTLVPLLTEQQMQEDLISIKLFSESLDEAHKIDIELEK